MTLREVGEHRAQNSFGFLHRGLTVELIATPREDLTMCNPDHPLVDVLNNSSESYDYLPVVDTGTIVGLLHARPLRDGDHPFPAGPVRQYMEQLSDRNLIGADATILDFILDLDSKPFRLVVSKATIAGLVTWADIQKLPVRAAIFALVTGLEITMTKAIVKQYPNDKDWLIHLSTERQNKIQEYYSDACNNDSVVDRVLYTQFCDKTTIIRRAFEFNTSKTQLKKRFGRMERLRNAVAHAHDYASTVTLAQEVATTIRYLLQLTDEIEKSLIP